MRFGLWSKGDNHLDFPSLTDKTQYDNQVNSKMLLLISFD